MKKGFMSTSVRATQKIATDFAKHLKLGDVVAFNGELGAGKTVFIQAIAKYLGISGYVPSPTFTLVREYPFNFSGVNAFFQHIDLYRIDAVDFAAKLSLTEMISLRDRMTCIEWAEKIPELIPHRSYTVTIEVVDVRTRKITIEYPTKKEDSG